MVESQRSLGEVLQAEKRRDRLDVEDALMRGGDPVVLNDAAALWSGKKIALKKARIGRRRPAFQRRNETPS